MTTTIRTFNHRIVSMAVDGPLQHRREDGTVFYSLSVIASDERGHTTELVMTADRRETFNLERV